VADPATNSLIIYGTAQEFQNIRNILKDLDAVPRQVLLDVLVLEVTLDGSESLGFDYEIKSGDTRIFERTFPSRGSVLTGILAGLGAAPAAGILSGFPGGVTGIFGSGNDVRVLVNALMSDSRVKILSSPSLLATDNRPARIQVGSEEPIATGQLTAATGALTPSSSTTIQYRNTGRIVTIIPQVNSQGLVNLQALIEVSQRGPLVQVGTLNDRFPSFDLRQAETTAVVQDGDTLVIGGIIAENKTSDKTGIPYLMDIPVIGRLFRSTSETNRRTELIMLITPHVIRNRSEGTSVTEEFKGKLSAVRSELEKKTRDQERLKPQTQPQKPAAPMPAPAVPAPAPAPSSAPAMPEAAQPPGRSISVPYPAEVIVPPTAPVRSIPEGEPLREARLEPVQVTLPSMAESSTAEKIVSAEALLPTNLPIPEPEPARETMSPVETAVEQSVEVAKVTEGKEAEPAGADPLGDLLQSIEAKKAPQVAAINVAPIFPKPSKAWVVQVAAFDRQKDAEELVYKLVKKGYHAVVSSANVNDKLWFRVQVGPFASRAEASELQKKLAATEKMAQSFVLNQ
jgi:cell division septation protein DedD